MRMDALSLGIGVAIGALAYVVVVYVAPMLPQIPVSPVEPNAPTYEMDQPMSESYVRLSDFNYDY